MTSTYTTVGFSGKTRTQVALLDAFNLVAPKSNWKLPIDVTLPRPFDADLVSDAIVHFTGAEPEFSYGMAHVVRVTAPGYYNTVGA